jgi:hypothetical protein
MITGFSSFMYFHVPYSFSGFTDGLHEAASNRNKMAGIIGSRFIDIVKN